MSIPQPSTRRARPLQAREVAGSRSELEQLDRQAKVLVAAKKSNATKIRRMYDVLNVLECIGVLEKKKSESKAMCGYRKGALPTEWTWTCTAPAELRAAFVQAPPSPVRARGRGPAATSSSSPPKQKKDNGLPRQLNEKSPAVGRKRKRSGDLTLTLH